MHHRYLIDLFWSDEDEGWIADVPDLTWCYAHGPTPGAALAEVEIAIEAWLVVQSQAGRPTPQPRYRPAIYATCDAA